MLAEKRAQVMDADQVVFELERAGQPVWQAIVERFGRQVLLEDGELDRAGLGRIVFGDSQALRDLELIVHPAVRQEIRRQLADAPSGGILVLDAIKLIESGMAEACNSVWAVTAPEQQQIERLLQRGLSSETAWQRVQAQGPQAEKVARADQVIDNSGSLARTQRQVEDAWQRTAGTFRFDATL